MAPMSFEVALLPSAATSTPPAPLSPRPAVRPAAAAKRNARALVVAPVARAASIAEPLPDPAPAVEAARAAEAAGAARLDLSPLAAARSIGASTPDNVVTTSRPDAGDARAEARLAEGIPGLVRDRRPRDRSVEELAKDLEGAALRPWDLVLRPLPPGRYRYRGLGFDAVIGSDGNVKYRDKDGIRLGVSLSQAIAGNRRRPNDSPTEAVFAPDLGDLREWSEKIAGKDPHAAERRRFLEQTRSLREYLREQAERSARRARNPGSEP